MVDHNENTGIGFIYRYLNLVSLQQTEHTHEFNFHTVLLKRLVLVAFLLFMQSMIR